MRIGTKRALVWIAIYALALQSILVGFAPLPAYAQAAGFDPLTIICHSSSDETGGDSQPGTLPARACDHCVLCNVTVASPAPDVLSLASLPVLRSARLPDTASAAPPVALHASPKLARAPPRIV